MSDDQTFTLVITRTFDAPAQLVYEAWTQPEHLMQWHCPEAFNVVKVESNPVPGGSWRCTMQDPKGQNYISAGQFLKMNPYAQLTLTHGWEDNHTEACHQGHMTVINLTFSESENQTTMRFEQTGLISAASRDSHHGGWSGAFVNLQRHLQNQTAR